jgi:hypothetical protein
MGSWACSIHGQTEEEEDGDGEQQQGPRTMRRPMARQWQRRRWEAWEGDRVTEAYRLFFLVGQAAEKKKIWIFEGESELGSVFS